MSQIQDNCAPAQGCASEVVSLERSIGCIVYTLVRVSQQSPSTLLWPAPVSVVERDTRRGWSLELEGHFRNMRRHAKDHCPPPMLPMFEDELRPIEATARAAVTGLLAPVLILSDHIRDIEAFQRKWVPYIDPRPKPPPRLRYDETDRSVWLDEKCLARELDRKQFGFVRSLVNAYPDPVKWDFISRTERGCLGANQTRLRNTLPKPVSDLLESSNDGYMFRLPDKLSTSG
jgi:hypothetical protein